MIRLGTHEDLEALDAISVRAVKAMHKQNIHQWDTDYPRKRHFAEDVDHGRLFVFETDEGKIAGAMALCEGPEQAYEAIDWLREKSLIVHRFLVDPMRQQEGIGRKLLAHAIKVGQDRGLGSIKIDTYPANAPMRKLLKHHQFTDRGYIASIHRIAYERLIDRSFLKRVIILGRSGSGKTTLARTLGEKLSASVLHLDTVYWLRNWTAIPKDEFQQKVRRFMREHPRFVMDGNYTNTPTFADRMRTADTVILLDYKLQEALKGLKRREEEYKHRYRSDMATGCIEEIDQKFLEYVTFFDGKRKRIESLMNAMAHKKLVLRFKTREALDDWLNTL